MSLVASPLTIGYLKIHCLTFKHSRGSNTDVCCGFLIHVHGGWGHALYDFSPSLLYMYICMFTCVLVRMYVCMGVHAHV